MGYTYGTLHDMAGVLVKLLAENCLRGLVSDE
jgi:hypothetical protein